MEALINTAKPSTFVETTRSDPQDVVSGTLEVAVVPEAARDAGTNNAGIRPDTGTDTSIVGKLGTDPYVLRSK
jgi:hypothetical protein